MKTEAFIRRVCDKVNSEQLYDVLMNGKDVSNLPDTCMVYGTPPAPSKREGVRKNSSGGAVRFQTTHKPYPIIQYQKRRQALHRLVYTWTYGDPPQGNLRQKCSTRFCINPLHWEPLETEIPMNFETDGWTLAEAEELLEIYLSKNDELDPNHPLLLDIPMDLLVVTLKKMKKEHLLP